MLNALGLKLIRFYQKVLTLFSFGSCRYYPTCSEYARWQMMHNGFFLALWKSALRILKCNQLFPGGIDYPVVTSYFEPFSYIKPFKQKSGKPIFFWFVFKKPNNYYIIRSFAHR